MGKFSSLMQRLRDAAQTVPPASFATSRGSQYLLLPDGSSVRYKAARAEHPGEYGWMDPSEKTVFLTDDQANALSIVQAHSPRRMELIRDVDTPRVAVAYAEGPGAWRPIRGTMVHPATSPLEGLLPLEMTSGYTPHFGNRIVDVREEPGWMEWLTRASRGLPPPVR